MTKQLDKKFFSKGTETVAKNLLGKIISFRDCEGIIVETEAYHGKEDEASHAARKSNKDDSPMHAKPGTSYVYLNYGVYYMFNVVTEKEGVPGAVLIRAVQPTEGLEIMRKRRRNSDDFTICAGPGKWTQSFGITTKHGSIDLTSPDSPVKIFDSKTKPTIVETTRIGITKGTEHKWRYYIKGNKYVSVK